MDSGVGGLTVAKEIKSLLPDEDIVYFGDSINCPYGNKSADEIFELSKKMIDFLLSKGAKCVAIACNTISTMQERLQECYDIPIVSIVKCGAGAVLAKKLSAVGLIATEFTVNSGAYQNYMKEVKVGGRGSHNLAALVDRGDFNKTDIENEIKTCVSDILKKGDIEALILGCSHYPIVAENFKNCYPDILLINPALSQAEKIKEILTENDALNKSGGDFSLYTSKGVENYLKIIEKLGFKAPDKTETITL